MGALDRDRSIHVLSGAIALILFCSAVYIGVLYTNGDAFKRFYSLYASFDAAGQGLQEKSDVKIHGVNVGQVKSVRLANGAACESTHTTDCALVKMSINDSTRVPVDARAMVKPKTLFGEKFVDLDPGSVAQETQGPFLAPGATITRTVGGFELENVLAAAYPILKAVNPADITVILDTLAHAGQGEGPAIARQLGNFQQLADLAVAHNLDIAQLLSDLALLTNAIADDSPTIIALAQSLNAVLPSINQRGDAVTSILGNLSRVSNDAANLLDANRATQDKLIVEGGQVLSALLPRLGQVGPTIVGIRQFVETLAEIGHIPYGQGTVLGAIKLVLGGGCIFGQVSPCLPTGTKPAVTATPRAATAAPPTTAPAARAPAGIAAKPGPANGGAQLVKGIQALLNLVGGLIPK